MKQLGIRRWVFILAIHGFLCSASWASDPMILGVPQFKPFTYLENGQIKGDVLDEVKRILDASEIRFKIIFIENYSLLIKAVKSKKIDGFFVATQNVERDRYAVFSKPIILDGFSWFILNDARYEFNSSDFKLHAKVGAVGKTNSFRIATRRGYQVYGQPLPLLAQQFTHKTLDAVFATEMAFRYQLDNLPFSKKHYRIIKDSERPFGLYISKHYLQNNKNVMQTINANIETRHQLQAKKNQP